MAIGKLDIYGNGFVNIYKHFYFEDSASYSLCLMSTNICARMKATKHYFNFCCHFKCSLTIKITKIDNTIIEVKFLNCPV
jgi:hypothetical protein